jgi:flagellar protein FliS
MPALEYVDNETLNVEPVELICLLYAKAIEKLNLGKDCFEAGQTGEGNRAIAFAMEIIVELQGALDKEGGDIARDLADLYDYMQNRLVGALSKTETAPIDEVVRLMTTLLDGWNEARPAPVIPDPATLPEAGTAEALAGHAWTL